MLRNCKRAKCGQSVEGFPGSEMFCPAHAREHEQVLLKSKTPEARPVILWCAVHGVVTTPIQPLQVRPARYAHGKAGCDKKLKTFVLDETRV